MRVEAACEGWRVRTETRDGRGRRALRVAAGVFAVLAIAVLLFAGKARAQSGQTGSGTINATIVHRSGISVVFSTHTGGMVLGGSGSYAVTMDFGNVSRYGALRPGVTRTATAGDFTVSTPFDVYVDLGGVSSASYTLTASLSAPPAPYSLSFDSTALSTTPAIVVTSDANYNTNQAHTLFLTVPFSVLPTTVTNTINVTAVAN